MKTLSTEFRRRLERAVIEARDVAEVGARVALEALAVYHHEPYEHMRSEQRTLRRRLRVHARQLGDRLDARSGVQSIDHLVHECAYEHWHGMLFARFLAENHLLIEPEMGVAISLDECEELAKEECVDKWALAARFAHCMLPQVFRPDHPVFEVKFSREHRLKLEGLIETLPTDVFTATDSLGWVYQFWQTKKKGKINAAGSKIGADELPAVTQLFTEDYMVDFLLDNTLGAWHASAVLAANPNLAETAQSDDELRHYVSLPGCPWKYLRFIKGKDGKWHPAANTFAGWPKTAKDLRCLDPCMGSGHFVVAMFDRLVALRMAEEQLDEKAAVTAVIQDNLFGLEIDPRCAQIGAFNLALAAWRRVGFRALPVMNLACSGLAPNTRKDDWLAIASEDERLRNGMERLYQLFEKAAMLGSLINPRTHTGDLLEAAFHELQPLMEEALAKETNDNVLEMTVTARGLAKAAEILAGQFTLVATNVPYLGRGKQDDALKNYCERAHPHAKAELATCFIDRCLQFCESGGSVAVVSPQNWFFLGTYRKFRENLLQYQSWSSVVLLGANAFRDMNWWAATTGLVTISKCRPAEGLSFVGFETSGVKQPTEKAVFLASGKLPASAARGDTPQDGFSSMQIEGPVLLAQADQAKNPDSRIVISKHRAESLIQDYAVAHHGLTTGDSERMQLCIWELARLTREWMPFCGSCDHTSHFSGRNNILRWHNGSGPIDELPGARKDGQSAWGHSGILIRQMRHLPCTIYTGEPFDNNTAVIVPNDIDDLLPLWAYLSSPDYLRELRKIDQKVSVTSATLAKVVFNRRHWQKVAAEKYPLGLAKPFSNDSTQWLFDGNPAGSDQPLQVAVARLLDYRWPRRTGSSFHECPALGSDDLEKLADKDGIVCVSAVRGERPAHEQVLRLLHAAYGEDWHEGILTKLLAESGSATLEDWLRNQFFEEHCKLYQHRPFIWHIWDGRKRDGFHALVNYHKLSENDGKGRRLLESLTYSYLGDWITRQQDGVKRGEGGAEDRLAAALELQKRLVAILEGEPPFDLFIRWKSIEQQPIGWEPDINDGVRLNIRPFMAQDIPGGKKGAGILRAKPNIHWKKDRGKEPVRDQTQFSWFWKDGEFTGERINDVHLTNAEKRAAREAAKSVSTSDNRDRQTAT